MVAEAAEEGSERVQGESLGAGVGGDAGGPEFCQAMGGEAGGAEIVAEGLAFVGEADAEKRVEGGWIDVEFGKARCEVQAEDG